jgi:hypothetical protein
MAAKPDKVTLRTYDVGFGDCFLLSFHYGANAKHVLIDFGSTRNPAGKAGTGNYLERIANQIKQDAGNKLTAVVATHRHKDHISGFTMSGNKGPGATIRALKPELVIQPWTEDPDAEPDAKKPTKSFKGIQGRTALHVRNLKDMNRYANYVQAAAKRLRGSHLQAVRDQLDFLGDDNSLANRDAITNLMTMGKRKPRYVYAGAKSGLETLLPGVKVHVLGPPTLEQEPRISTQTDTQADEFWHLRTGFWAKRATLLKHTAQLTKPLFPAYVMNETPWDARWYRYYAQKEQADSLLSIVRSLDEAMNNTSVILLFEIGATLLLFPGDAQWENWRYALSKPENVQRLSRVNVYKVGHHGSLNATPKSLWKGFTNKGGANAAKRLLSLLSTKDGVHGGKHGEPTEVPRSILVDALKSNSTLVDTRDAAATDLRLTREIDLS